MKELDMEPVFAGYSGMLPHDVKEKLGLPVADPGLWCSYKRPSFLLPSDKSFANIAELYYAEQKKLFGTANYYSMDPFHEGGNIAGVDLPLAGKSIYREMKKVNPKAVWLLQAWHHCPYQSMIDPLPVGDVIVIDLYSESRPQWGVTGYPSTRKGGFGRHQWIYSTIANFGGNIGLHGKLNHIIKSFQLAREHPQFSKSLIGLGSTMEGAENNPIIYELQSDMIWENKPIALQSWLHAYTASRYGKKHPVVTQAWELLADSIYNCPPTSTQQGTTESIFCARPSMQAYQASTWAEMSDYYEPEKVIEAAEKLLAVADEFEGNDNFEHDLVDIVRQSIAERGRLSYRKLQEAYKAKDSDRFNSEKKTFLDLILLQDDLLSTQREFQVGYWIEKARNLGQTPEEKNHYEWNARVQISSWANRQAAEQGGLRGYAHREWNGILKDLYHARWKQYLDGISVELESGKPAPAIDFYKGEEDWARQTQPYPSRDAQEVIPAVKKLLKQSTAH